MKASVVEHIISFPAQKVEPKIFTNLINPLNRRHSLHSPSPFVLYCWLSVLIHLPGKKHAKICILFILCSIEDTNMYEIVTHTTPFLTTEYPLIQCTISLSQRAVLVLRATVDNMVLYYLNFKTSCCNIFISRQRTIIRTKF